MLVRRLIRSRIQAQTSLTARSYQGTDKHIQPKKPYGTLPDEQEKNFIPFESPLVSTQNRYEDEPAPTNDDMIVTHYLKHHPLYEFRNLEEFHIDNYRHWLHARVDYYNTETHPAEVSAWERGSKFNHLLVILFPIFSFTVFGRGYKEHLKQKNVKMPIVGVFSQCSV